MLTNTSLNSIVHIVNQIQGKTGEQMYHAWTNWPLIVYLFELETNDDEQRKLMPMQ